MSYMVHNKVYLNFDFLFFFNLNLNVLKSHRTKVQLPRNDTVTLT